MFIRYFVSLHFSEGVQLRQGIVEGCKLSWKPLEDLLGEDEGEASQQQAP